MAKLTLNESLERMSREAERVKELREELAIKIGLFVLKNDESITTITAFKNKYSELLENSDIFEEFQEYIKAKKEIDKISNEKKQVELLCDTTTKMMNIQTNDKSKDKTSLYILEHLEDILNNSAGQLALNQYIVNNNNEIHLKNVLRINQILTNDEIYNFDFSIEFYNILTNEIKNNLLDIENNLINDITLEN